MMKPTRKHRLTVTMSSAILSLALVAAACGSDADTTAADPNDSASTTAEVSDVEKSSTDAATDDSEGAVVSTGGSCDEIAALFVTAGSANADLADPEVSGTCDGDNVVVTSNGIPDYTYIETSPGHRR